MKTSQVLMVFDALSQETRLAIFRLLVENSKIGMTPTDISLKLNNIPRNTISFHLSLLSKANLCETKRDGKQIIYKPKCKTIESIAEFLLKDCCDKSCSC